MMRVFFRRNGSLFVWVLIILLFAISASFAFYNFLSNNAGTNVINLGTIKFNYTESTQGLTIDGSSVVDDITAMSSNDYFSFSVSSSSTGVIDIGYYVYLIPEVTNNISNDLVNVYLTRVNDNEDSIENEIQVVQPEPISNLIPFSISTLSYSESSNNYLLYSNNLSFNNNDATQTHYYRLRMWLDESAVDSNPVYTDESGEHTAIFGSDSTYSAKVSVYGHNGAYVTITNPS